MVRFYQQNTLSHKDGDRKVKINEASEKMPWQWQYDRDDDALLDKYYRTLDDLYIFLEENTVAKWQNSPLRKKLTVCFIKERKQKTKPASSIVCPGGKTTDPPLVCRLHRQPPAWLYRHQRSSSVLRAAI